MGLGLHFSRLDGARDKQMFTWFDRFYCWKPDNRWPEGRGVFGECPLSGQIVAKTYQPVCKNVFTFAKNLHERTH